MVRISPFRAYRPQAGVAGQLVSVPYDVVDREEARALAAGNPLCFLRVVRSDLEFPDDVDPYSPAIYDRARDNFQRLLADGALFREAEPCLYVYRLTFQGRSQTGLVCRVHADDYLEGRIKKHELTRPDKEQDRTRHVDHLGINAGPVFLAHRSEQEPEIQEILETYCSGEEPLYDLTRADGVRHEVFRVEPGEGQERLVRLFSFLPALYIADGHHRAASAANVCAARRQRQGGGSTDAAAHDWFLAVSFPDRELRILPYNRVIRAPDGFDSQTFLTKLEGDFEVVRKERPIELHEVRLFLDGRWIHLRARPHTYEGADAIESLDVAILGRRVLKPLLGIEDQRTSDRISFVGGIRGDQELERLVNSGRYTLAFSMFPTTMDQLLAVADAGKIMPPKSTWFEPKLCSGFLVNSLNDE